MINKLTAGFGAIYGTAKGNQSLNPSFAQAIEAGINPLNIPALKDFTQQKNVERISQEQESYQANMQRRSESLNNPSVKQKPENKQLSVAPTNEDAVKQEQSKIGSSEIPPPSNTQGNAKPLFDPSFQEKANFLAGTGSQVEKAGF